MSATLYSCPDLSLPVTVQGWLIFHAWLSDSDLLPMNENTCEILKKGYEKKKDILDIK